jgi:hypothetical protein
LLSSASVNAGQQTGATRIIRLDQDDAFLPPQRQLLRHLPAVSAEASLRAAGRCQVG